MFVFWFNCSFGSDILFITSNQVVNMPHQCEQWALRLAEPALCCPPQPGLKERSRRPTPRPLGCRTDAKWSWWWSPGCPLSPPRGWSGCSLLRSFCLGVETGKWVQLDQLSLHVHVCPCVCVPVVSALPGCVYDSPISQHHLQVEDVLSHSSITNSIGSWCAGGSHAAQRSICARIWSETKQWLDSSSRQAKCHNRHKHLTDTSPRRTDITTYLWYHNYSHCVSIPS